MAAIILEGTLAKTTILRRPNGLETRGHLFIPNETQPRPTPNFGPLYLRAVSWQSEDMEFGVEFRGTVYHNPPPNKSAVHQVSECRGGYKKKCKAMLLAIRIN